MIPRHIGAVLLESLRHFPVVLLVGPRQAGKSTLVLDIASRSWKAPYVTLDDRTVLDAALTNPDGFLQELGERAIIDEVQRAPDLLRAVKLVVDRGRRAGRFLLTGSANVITLARVSETLAGRVAVHELHPFSWAEIRREKRPSVLETLFEAPSAASALRASRVEAQAARPRELQERILAGGFPPAVLMGSSAARATWFESYRQTYVERDVREIAGVEHLPEFGRLMATLALRTGQMVNFSAMSRDLGLASTTLRRYFNVLSQTYQAFLVPPFSANLGKRLVKTPKVYAGDTGLACHLTAADRWEVLERQNRAGAMVETWAAGEIRKLLSVARRRTELSFWRSHSGEEVDFLLERGNEVVGVEVKGSAGFRAEDLRGLVRCREALGRRWRAGVLVHGGTESVALDDRTVALPFARFFRGGS